MSGGIIFVAYFLIILSGFGKVCFSDNILLALVGAGTLQSGAVIFITRSLFPGEEIVTSSFRDVLKTGLDKY